MMREKTGFTLIELLAVLALLAIISLITIPIALGIIENVRKNAFGESARNTVKAADLYYAENDLLKVCYEFNYSNDVTDKTLLEEIDDRVYYQISTNELNLSGKEIIEGEMVVCGIYAEAELSDGTYTYILKRNGDEIILKGSLGANDLTAPIIDGVTLIANTNTIKAVVNAHEEDTGRIDKYYFSIDGKNYFESTTNQYTFNNLEKNKEYTIYVKVINKSGLESNTENETAMTMDMTNPTLAETSKTPASGYSYATSRVIKITYSNTNISNPEYYFKSNVSATVSTGVVTESCGTGTTPSACTISSVTTLVANTWYKTSNETPSIAYNQNGTLYALTSDNTNISGTSTYEISKMDIISPEVTVNLSGAEATLTLTDNNGVIGYAVTTSTTTPTEWITITSTSSTVVTYTAEEPKTYYAHVLDVAGNTTYTSFNVPQTAFSYEATATPTSYAASQGESCSSCRITSVSNYGSCCANGCTTSSTDSNYHYGTCSNGQSITNSICGYGVSVGQYKYYDCKTTYSCPSGGTLSGSTCTKIVYTCPNGGTLSGTTCVFN